MDSVHDWVSSCLKIIPQLKEVVHTSIVSIWIRPFVKSVKLGSVITGTDHGSRDPEISKEKQLT